MIHVAHTQLSYIVPLHVGLGLTVVYQGGDYFKLNKSGIHIILIIIS